MSWTIFDATIKIIFKTWKEPARYWIRHVSESSRKQETRWIIVNSGICVLAAVARVPLEFTVEQLQLRAVSELLNISSTRLKRFQVLCIVGLLGLFTAIPIIVCHLFVPGNAPGMLNLWTSWITFCNIATNYCADLANSHSGGKTIYKRKMFVHKNSKWRG